MAALALAASGLRVRVAGTDLPVDEIASLARELKTRAVAVSVSLAGQPHAARYLRALRDKLPRATLLLVGGQGAPASMGRHRARPHVLTRWTNEGGESCGLGRTNGLRAADCGPPQHPGTSALGTSALGTAGTSARGTSAPRHFSL